MVCAFRSIARGISERGMGNLYCKNFSCRLARSADIFQLLGLCQRMKLLSHLEFCGAPASQGLISSKGPTSLSRWFVTICIAGLLCFQ